jgi:hypothetical protein
MAHTVNLDFVRNVVGKSRVAAAAVVCRTPNGFPLPNGFQALPMTELTPHPYVEAGTGIVPPLT